MLKSFYHICFLVFLSGIPLNSTGQSYNIELLSFSSRINSEFSPVFYGDGLIYSSNKRDNSLVGYVDSISKLYKIYYIPREGSNDWGKPRLLASELTSGYNDGPVTFNKEKNIIYFSRNIDIRKSLKDIDDTTNTLGIYSAILVNGTWSDIKPAPCNNPDYNFTTPSLTYNAKRLYFSSNMPGGEGGLDIYYCDIEGDRWSEAVNLGSLINTHGDESFPWVDNFGTLYFSSDSLPGNGGKDIFYTFDREGLWIKPVHLDSTINSSADDFGILIDSTFNSGYFSSNRRSSDDIYSFNPIALAFNSCTEYPEDSYCYSFYDKNTIVPENTFIRYVWNFEGGIKREGREVIHCFPGPGDYKVTLLMFNKLSGDTIGKLVSHDISIEKTKNLNISSPSLGIIDTPLTFELIKPGDSIINISEHYWNTGDGFVKGNARFTTSFEQKGSYTVMLGMMGRDDKIGDLRKYCITKKIKIFESIKNLSDEIPADNNALEESVISQIPGKQSIQAQIYTASNLTRRNRRTIYIALKSSVNHMINIDPSGSISSTDSLLNNIATLLNSNPDLGLGVVAHNYNNNSDSIMKGSGRWIREIRAYLITKELNSDFFAWKVNTASGLFTPPGKLDIRKSDGLIEFIIYRKEKL